jgi:AAA domain
MNKLEKKNTRLQIGRKARYKRTDTYIYETGKKDLSFLPIASNPCGFDESKKWTVYNDVEDNDLKPIVDRVIELNGCFIARPAGTGKSQLIRQTKQELQNKGKTFSCLAPTNLAAINIKGTTVHKFVSKFKKMDSLFNFDVDYLFIYEISMLQEIFYKFFIMIKRIKPNFKFIIAGDFNQLPPVKDRIGESFNYSNCQALLELCDFNKVQLSKCKRSDGFVVDFETINNIKKESFKSNFTLRHLAFTNKNRIAINNKCMDSEAQKYKKSKIYIEKNINDSNSQDMKDFPKLPIICKVNSKEHDVVNNKQFIVTKLDNKFNNIIDVNEEKELKLSVKEFGEMMYLAYCITIHCSQGQSYDDSYTIHEWWRLTDKLKYVDLTRATNKDLINII